MNARIEWFQASPGATQALLGVQNFINDCGLEHPLLELVKMRASQINGCAYCIDMHAKDARAAACNCRPPPGTRYIRGSSR